MQANFKLKTRMRPMVAETRIYIEYSQK